MNDQRFFDLAMKVIARQASAAERAELDALLARQPELKSEFARLEADARTAKAALSLVEATQATAGELPAYARGRLQTKVRQTLGRPKTADESGRKRRLKWQPLPVAPPAARPRRSPHKEESLLWRWRWILGLATATAVILLVLIPAVNKSPQPLIQLALLDVAGMTRGPSTNEIAILQETWKQATVVTFSRTGEVEAWKSDWPEERRRPIAKIIYDRAAGEVRVAGRWKNKNFEKTFPIENDLATALRLANDFVQAQTKR